MKGFPNQTPDLKKLATGMQCIQSLRDRGENPKDDGILGQALVRAGVAGTGHVRMSIQEYIREQFKKPQSYQSFRTTARGLRELYRLLGFIDDSGPTVEITPTGLQAAALADTPSSPEQLNFWRRVIRRMTHAGGDEESSHPYQVLLRLVAQKPGIPRAKCALALEAKNDSSAELERILELVDLNEGEIIKRLHVTKFTWDNAKKILPSFAEQLGDVIKEGQGYILADAPGESSTEIQHGVAEAPPAPRPSAPRAPRKARSVDHETIARAALERNSDEVDLSLAPDPRSAAEAARTRRERLHRHNQIVRTLAERLDKRGYLYEDPFDLLKIIDRVGILAEIKTLNGSIEDERERVRDALSQLLYYEAFVAAPLVGGGVVHKIACFEQRISEEHSRWLNQSNIGVIWLEDEQFAGDELATDFLGDYLEQLR